MNRKQQPESAKLTEWTRLTIEGLEPIAEWIAANANGKVQRVWVAKADEVWESTASSPTPGLGDSPGVTGPKE